MGVWAENMTTAISKPEHLEVKTHPYNTSLSLESSDRLLPPQSHRSEVTWKRPKSTMRQSGLTPSARIAPFPISILTRRHTLTIHRISHGSRSGLGTSTKTLTVERGGSTSLNSPPDLRWNVSQLDTT